MDEKMIFVGMNNPRGEEPFWPRPHGSTGHRLFQLVHEAIGWDAAQYCDRTTRINFCTGARWTLDAAKKRREEILGLCHGKRAIAVGVIAGNLLDGPEDFFEWSSDGVAVIPHTSGANRAYNDPDVRRKAVAFLREALNEG